MKAPRSLAVIDYETDPFEFGEVPAPFVAGFYEIGNYLEFWGADCVQQLVDYLGTREDPLLIYAHNGGKFDFFFMLAHLENPLKVINGRIASCRIGPHELRDSYAILPIPLSAYKKDEVDYSTFKRDVRHLHRPAISKYLKADCVYLYDLVLAFLNRFGEKLTIGGTAIAELRKYHPFENQRERHDTRMRAFYFGGRCEAFDTGVFSGDWKIYDVNSMYSHVMHSMDHPTGSEYLMQWGGIVDKRGRISGVADCPMYFAHIECQQQGAFPTRVDNRPLDFNRPSGEFWVTSHELRAAMDTRRVQNIRVIDVTAPRKVVRFAEFVQVFMAEKIRAKKEGDRVAEIFSKLILNSSYGKFAQNPDKYFNYVIQGPDDEMPDDPELEIYLAHETGARVWRKPAKAHQYLDVATAASITGAARSVLMRALAVARRPMYCDTDSIICEQLGAEIDATKLGAWKLEATGDTLAIAGKKLYALKSGAKLVKKAHKGALLNSDDIFRLARGGTAVWRNDAPSFSLAKGVSFVERELGKKKLLATGTKKR